MRIKITKIKRPIVVHSIAYLGIFKWDGFWAYHPSLVEYKKKFYLFYTGKGVKRGISHQIGIATSLDLKKWKKYPENPILKEGERNEWDSDFVAHEYIFKDGNTFYMLYDGSKKGDWREEIGVAKSSNLINWERYKKNPIFKVGTDSWERKHVSRACIFKKNGLYYLFYAGHDGTCERIGLARGKSVFNIERFLKEPVLDIGEKGEWDEKSISDPKIIRHKNLYLMFYSGMDRNGVERVGAAVSSDLIKWEKYRKNPVIDVSSRGWDRISAARADVQKVNGQYYMFYSGRRRYFYDIGMAKVHIA